MPAPGISIQPLAPLLKTSRLVLDLDDIFFGSSTIQGFDSIEERDAFRERWLGRYLTTDARHGFAAIAGHETGEQRLVGYVVGSLDDPAASPRFSDIPFYSGFAAQSARYPAHLHINLAEAHRSKGLGGQLIEAFCGSVVACSGASPAFKDSDKEPITEAGDFVQATAGGIGGVHVVTSLSARNAGFYRRHDFLERARIGEGENVLVFLGRDLPGC